MDIIEKLFNISQGTQDNTNNNSYLAEDGLLHCQKCNQKIQTKITILGQIKKVPCACKCKKEEIKKQEEREKRQEIERNRCNCFSQNQMFNWTFENDDKNNIQISNALLSYAQEFEEHKKNSRGLILYGSVGTGKSYYCGCIANKLIDDGYRVLMTNFTTIINKLSSMYEDKNLYIESLNNYSLLILDDLGVERKTEYMQEMVYNIIDSRYRSGLPFIITTNLNIDDLTNPVDIGNARIYDRILEKCFPIEIKGKSKRRRTLINNYEIMKNKLNI